MHFLFVHDLIEGMSAIGISYIYRYERTDYPNRFGTCDAQHTPTVQRFTTYGKDRP